MIPAFFLRRLDIPAPDWQKDILFVFLASEQFDDTSFATLVTRDIKENLEPDEVFILVRDSVFDRVVSAFGSSLILDQLRRQRLNDRVPIYVASFGATGSIERQVAYPAGTQESVLRVDDTKRMIVTSIFRERRGFVESSASYHFENPSGKHTERFIRLSNILHSSAEISFLAFCALPYIPETLAVVYVDTPALFSLVSAINDHLRALALGRPPLFVESFGSYQGLDEFRFDDPINSVVIISASSSGSLGELLIAKHGFERAQLVHFLYLGPPQDTLRVVADLSFDTNANPLGYKELPSKQKEGECTLCEAGSSAIPLRGDQFEPAGPQTEPIYLRQVDAPADLRALVAGMAGRNIVGVGLGSKNSSQPRLYNVDAAHLASSTRFSEALEYVIRRSTPVGTAYVVYLDEGSRPFAEMVATHSAAVSSRPEVIGAGELDKIGEETDNPVVVVSAVIESGRSLLDVSRDLRTMAPTAPLVYVVGFNKTSGEDRRESLDNNLSKTHAAASHEVVHVESITLPPSVEDHAWSREREVLRELLTTGSLDDGDMKFVGERLALLSDRNNVLHNNLFMPTPTGGPLRIRPGFVFAGPDGDTSEFDQADVFFIISSILQRLRANSAKPGARALRSNWFQQTVLAPDTFSRFNDGIIQAGFLRAATPNELNYVVRRDLGKELARVINRIVIGGGSARGEAALEFLMALCSNRLSLHAEDLQKALPTSEGLPSLVASLVDFCRNRLTPG